MDKVTVGRRKASVARAVIKAGKGEITINGKDYKQIDLRFKNEVYAQQRNFTLLKNSSTTSCASPIASKTCAPV